MESKFSEPQKFQEVVPEHMIYVFNIFVYLNIYLHEHSIEKKSVK